MILSDSQIPWTASSCCSLHFPWHIAVSVRPPPLPGPGSRCSPAGQGVWVHLWAGTCHLGLAQGPPECTQHPHCFSRFPFIIIRFLLFHFSSFPFPPDPPPPPQCIHTVNPPLNSWMTIPASRLKVTWCPFCCVQSGHQDLSRWTDLSGLHCPSSPGSGGHCGAACPPRRGWKVGASLTVTGEGQQARTVQCVSVPWVMTRGTWN